MEGIEGMEATPAELEHPNTAANLEDLMARMTQAINQNQTQTPTVMHDITATQIGIKLDGTNYALWSQIVEKFISGKDKLEYINGDLPQPEPNDPSFRRWRTENSVVKGWLISSMNPSLANNFIQFLTAKQVWDSIAVTYFYGTDTSQVAKTGNSSSHGGKLNPKKTKGHVEGGCSHCGNLKHTHETCFKIHGYPEWWTKLKARKQKEAAGGTGRAAMVNSAPINPEATLSLVPLVESKEDMAASLGNPGNNSSNDSNALLVSNACKNEDWIMDSGATDHMMFCQDDLVEISEPRRNNIFNANGVMYPVKRAETVDISSSIPLANTLLDILMKKIIGRGTKREGLYYMNDFSFNKVNTMSRTSSAHEEHIWLWHARCETCILAKSHCVPFPTSMNKSDIPFTLIHSDVWGPSPITTISGIRWFVTFVDNYTRMTWLYLLKCKDEVFGVFRAFHAMIQNQYSAKVRILRTDNGGEFCQNNVTLPSLLLIKPHIFGCVAFVHLHKNQRTKLEPCAVRCIFLGYGTNKKGYRCYDPNKNRVYLTMDVTFVELNKFYSPHISASSLQRETWDEEQKWWTEQIEETVVTAAPTVVTMHLHKRRKPW
ncbi:uncharacterized protein [Populus alba]|uniref:uncharacterized protein n=1 Tax=Populus alba TaxID=43335 RepID=UPI003CC7458A